jgi:predicted ribosome quality control (RQC) complex YloA/Tae2 family protein
MAKQGDNEHRMVFDIRGKRRNVVKVVYAILAVLMGLSLFLVTGVGNIGDLFGNGGNESGAGAKVYEEQATRIERKLTKSPEDPELLLALTRAQLNAGNQLVEQNSAGQTVLTTETIQKYQQASETWSDYLKATNEPSPNGAQLIAPTFVTLAESSRSAGEFKENMQSAAEAAEIVAKKRPSLNSLSTLAYYDYFAFDNAGAEKARTEAIALTKEKFERENLENQLDEYKKRAAEVEKQIKSIEKANKASGANGKESLENPFGGLGGGGLAE